MVITRPAYEALYGTTADVPSSAAYVVVAGHRRLAAAEAVGADTLDVVVRDELAASKESFVAAALDENVQREPLDPFDEADAVEELVQLYGSQTTAAARLGYTQGWISQRLTLRGLIDELRNEVRAKRLSIEAARKLARKPSEEQLAIWQAKYNGDEDGQALRRNAEDAARAAAERAVRSLSRTLARLDQAVRTETVASVVREQLTNEERRHLLDLLAKDDITEETTDSGITP